jgi:hypothetical protein
MLSAAATLLLLSLLPLLLLLVDCYHHQHYHYHYLDEQHDIALGSYEQRLQAQLLLEEAEVGRRLPQQLVRCVRHAPGVHNVCYFAALLIVWPAGTQRNM